MTVEMVTPAWMHEQVTAEQYATWTEEQCAGIEIVDGMVLVRPSASKRHNRLARLLANALDAAAGPDWNADTDFDVQLQHVPLLDKISLPDLPRCERPGQSRQSRWVTSSESASMRILRRRRCASRPATGHL